MREQALQKGPHILSEGLLDDLGKLLTPPTDRAQDQLRQPRVTGDFNLFANQNIDTAPEDDLGFDLESHQDGDLFEQEAACRKVEGPETIEGPDGELVTLAGARMIAGPSRPSGLRAQAAALHTRYPAGGKRPARRIFGRNDNLQLPRPNSIPAKQTGNSKHLSKLTGQTTIIKEQVTRSGRGLGTQSIYDDAGSATTSPYAR